MRVMHQNRGGERPHVEPLCGDWGAMDTDWTDAADEVTCAACREVLQESRTRASVAAHDRALVARRDGERW